MKLVKFTYHKSPIAFRRRCNLWATATSTDAYTNQKHATSGKRKTVPSWKKKVEVSNFFLFFFYFSFYNGSRSIGTYAKIYSKTFPPILRLFFLLLFSFLVYFSQHSRGWNQPTVTQRSSEAGDCGISLRFSIATNQHSSDQMRGKRWKCKTMEMKCFRIVIYLMLSSFVKRVSEGLGTVKELCFRVR